MIELELTYLAKSLPDLSKCESKEMIDMYIPKEAKHPVVRIRKMGNRYEMTKKEPIDKNDSSKQKEQTIILREDEFNALMKLDGKKTHKIRYYYNHNGNVAEIDVFQEKLKGLVVVDFEFNNEEEKANFKMPDFCLVDVIQEEFIAGGMVCGKSYEDIEKELEKFNYKKISLD